MPCRSDLPNHVVVAVRHKQIAGVIQSDCERIVEPRGGPLAIVASRRPGLASQGGHVASRRDLSDGVVGRVRDIDIAGCVHCHAARVVEQRHAG